ERMGTAPSHRTRTGRPYGRVVVCRWPTPGHGPNIERPLGVMARSAVARPRRARRPCARSAVPVRSAPVTTTAPTPRIGRPFAESVAAFPPRPKPVGAPNVVVVLLDDVGFAQLGAFGSDIATPNMDRLGAEGLRYQRFHVTALCSPSRAS